MIFIVKLNENIFRLKSNYLFAEVAKRTKEFSTSHPEAKIIRLGIGDVTLPLIPAVVDAMNAAVTEMGTKEGFKGYPDYEGYAFLREAIIKNDFENLDIKLEEVFISDGAKSDCANIQELFSYDAKIAVTDPVYPVYVDSNIMAGRGGEFVNEAWSEIEYLKVNSENNFVPELPKTNVDIIYLCFPNNPTGSVLTREQLKKFVDWANEHKSIIIFDSAYEAYVANASIPKSIYEIEGAKTCAIEIRSFSKNAGFTGVRCSYTIIPNELKFRISTGEEKQLNKVWLRRLATKFNGVNYIAQRGAAAIYTPEGKEQVKQNIEYYMQNAKVIKEGLEKAGFTIYGGVHSPYVWLKTPDGLNSWDFFDQLLLNTNVVGTPGSGFGKAGEGYFRLTSFGTHENTKEAIARILKWKNKN